MPEVVYGGGTLNANVDDANATIFTNLTVAAGRIAANGQGPKLITSVSAEVAGIGGSVTLRLFAGTSTTNVITRPIKPAGNDYSSGLISLTSSYYIANGASPVSFGYNSTSRGTNFNRGTTGATYRRDSINYDWAGTIGGSYFYIESPSAPRTLTATASTTVTGQVNLSWLAPSDNGGSAVTNYNVYRVSGATYTLLGSTTGTTYAATGLTAGTSYTFAIRARNLVTDTAGTQSVDSNTATATAPYIPPPVTAPTAPTALSATTSTTVLGAVDLSWTAPSNDGDGAGSVVLTDYDIYVNGVYFASKGGTGTTYTATGLTQLSTSSFTVLAKNSGGFSSPQSSAVSGKASGLPTAPIGLTVVPDTLTTGTLNLSWSAPADAGVGGVTGYLVYNASTNALIVDQAGTGTTYSHTGRTVGTEYSYYVRARNAIGIAQDPDQYGAQSNSASAIAVTVTGAPNVVASTTVAGRLILTWTAGVGAASYTIRNKTTGAAPVVVSANVTTYVVDNLPAGIEYGFTKQPDNGTESETGYGTPLDTSTQTLATTAITNATNTQLSTATATITSVQSDSFTYAKDVDNLAETQVSSLTENVTNKTNQDLTDAYGAVTKTITATTVTSPFTFTYARASGTALASTSSSGTVLANLTNAELNTLGASVTVPGGAPPITTFTYTTTAYTGSAIDIASGGTATNLSQTTFNVTQSPVTAVTDYTLSYAKTAANQDTSAATGTITNTTNQQIFNKNTGNDIVRVVPDYKTVKYPVVGGLKVAISTTAQATTVVTVTTSANHYFKTGDTVTIQGSTNGSGVFNGQWTNITVTGDTTFTFTRTTATITSASDTAATADVDVALTTVANPTDSVSRVTGDSDTKLEVIYRSGWIG